MDIIIARNVTRTFNSGSQKVYALNNVNISISQGKLVILRGRSGSGKTTLINLLSGLDRPDSGEIFLDGEKITSLSDAKRDEIRRLKLGFVFQSVALISMMSAYENVDFGLRLAGYDPKKRTERAKECLHLVGLAKRMDHRAHELSGGEQQRVAIARAIALRPRILFADEPTSELDTLMGLHIVKVFRELVEKQGITIMMTTHDPNMVEVADEVITLEDGKIEL